MTDFDPLSNSAACYDLAIACLRAQFLAQRDLAPAEMLRAAGLKPKWRGWWRW